LPGLAVPTDRQPAAAGQLHQRHADPAARPVDQQRRPGGQVEVREGVPGGARGDRQRRRLLGRDPRRAVRGEPGGDPRPRRPAALHVRAAAEHLVAGGEPGDAVADLQHGPGDLAAEDRGPGDAVVAVAHPPVARVDPGRPDPHEQLTRPGPRLLDLDERLLLRATRRHEPVPAHPPPP
jgi:hypothetical protein